MARYGQAMQQSSGSFKDGADLSSRCPQLLGCHGNICRVAMKLEPIKCEQDFGAAQSCPLSLKRHGRSKSMQQVWSAWRGEALRKTMLMIEGQVEYMTIGTLCGPQHAEFWRRLCEHRQLFIDTGFAVVQAALEQYSNEGDFLISPSPMVRSTTLF